MQHILVIEDEPRLRALLIRLLGTAGYRATGVGTGAAAMAAMMTDEYALALLDLNLPDVRGEDVLRVLRASKRESRVIVLSSVSEIGRRIEVLESGADDFVQKPFVNAELLARIRLRLRAVEGEGQSGARTENRLAVSQDVFLDVNRRELQVGAARVALSQREFTLLNHLLDRRGKVCTRQELLADVWGLEFDPGTNVVDVCVRRLRAKVAGDAIETVRNVGYRLIAS